jgi:predicted nuclease of restriction endonuclease-like (RecB) superfamily
MITKRNNNFDGLINNISQVHNVLQGCAVKFINQFLTVRNWIFGYYIVEYEQNGEDRAKYGDKLLEEIAQKLSHIKGLRFRELYVCKDFYQTYPYFLRTVSVKLQALNLGQDTILRTLSAKLQREDNENDIILQTLSPELLDGDKLHPELLLSRLNYSHFIELVRVSDPLQRLFYEVETIKNNWSVRELKRAITTQLAFRTTMSTNKDAVIAKIKNLKPVSNVEIIRNPYVLEFLGLEEKTEFNETDLEQQILNHLQQFLIELGTGFCFEARQKRITFNNKHYRIDLVFYHRILKCHVLIDLKIHEFNYADAGQMNLYLNYYKDNEMNADDNPPVGIILCADKDDTLVEYSTAGMDDRLFVSKYLVNLPEKNVLEAFIRRELGMENE